MSQHDELKQIFESVTGGDMVVTEPQDEQAKSSTISSERKILNIIEDLREDFPFQTSLSNSQLVTVVKGHFSGMSDREIARNIGDGGLDKTVSRSRLSLHLVRADDLDTDALDIDALKRLLKNDLTNSECANRLDVSKTTVGTYKKILTAKKHAQEEPYHDRFKTAVTDDSLEPMGLRETLEDGLDDATGNEQTI